MGPFGVIEIIIVNVHELAHTLILLVVYDTLFLQIKFRLGNRPNRAVIPFRQKGTRAFSVNLISLVAGSTLIEKGKV